MRNLIHPALFLFGCMATSLLFTQHALAQSLCPTDRADEVVKVKTVVDGDTLHLLDGRKLRVIGINTPELARNGQPAEPYAEAAKQFVRETLATHGSVTLRFDKQRKDRHGRTLAHVFVHDGSSLSALLAHKGYGQAVNISPNSWNSACYFLVDKDARKHKRGVWGHARFNPIDAAKLTSSMQGFYLVKGTVTRVGKSRNAYWLQLASSGKPDVAIRVPTKQLRQFNFSIPTLLGREVEARGWLYFSKHKQRNELRMTVTNGDMLTRN